MGLSFKERLHNALGAQQIEVLKVYHAYVHSVSYEREEFDKIWFKEKIPPGFITSEA